MNGAAILALRHHRGFGGGVVATRRSAPPCPLAAAAPEDEPARPLFASLGRGRGRAPRSRRTPGRCAPRGRGGVCAPAPAARAAPRDGSPDTPYSATYPSPNPPAPSGQAACVRRPDGRPGACPRLRRRTAPAPTPARSSWGARSLDGGGLRCGDSPDRGGPGSLRRQPGRRFARPWAPGEWSALRLSVSMPVCARMLAAWISGRRPVLVMTPGAKRGGRRPRRIADPTV